MSLVLSPYHPPKDMDMGHGQGQKIKFIMDKDILRNLMAGDEQFGQFWDNYRPDEIRFPNRKLATYGLWHERIQPTKNAMCKYVEEHDMPKWKNPYFFVQEFPDPEPHNYRGELIPPGVQVFSAKWKGKFGMYTALDIKLYQMSLPE